MWNELVQAAGHSGGVLAGVSAILAVLTTFLIKKKSTENTLTVEERAQLSLDETEFRKSILIQLKTCQDAHRKASDEREEFFKRNIALERRLSELESKCFSCLYRASQESGNG